MFSKIIIILYLLTEKMFWKLKLTDIVFVLFFGWQLAFQRGPYGAPSRSNGTQGVQMLLVGVHTRISKEPIATCNFPEFGGGVWNPLCPLM